MEQSRTDAALQPDAAASGSPLDAPADDAALNSPDGKIVAIESGRQRRDGRAGGERNRGDRTERRERRKHRTGSDGDAAATTEPDPMTETGENAVAVLDGRLQDQAVAELAATGQRVLTAPLMPTDAPERSVDRTRSQLEAAERAIAGNPDVTAVVAPLVRHVNTVTEQLNSAQILLGRTMAERDALKLKVADLMGVEVSEISMIDSLSEQAASGASIQLKPVEAAAANVQPESGLKGRLAPSRLGLGVSPGASPDQVKQVARKRQLIAACLFAAVGIGLIIAQRQGSDISKVSRDSLADLQFVGIFFNMFFMVWMLYRVVRVGGKGAKWLFPQEPTRRSRR